MANNSIRVVIQKPVNTSLLGVQTVMGAIVDNTDPQNPVIINTSGTNTGDETTGTIQSKRPLKTVNFQSLEGSGDIEILGGVTSVNTQTGDVVLTGEDIETSAGSGFTVNGAIVTVQGEVVILQTETLAQQIEIDDLTTSVSTNEGSILDNNANIGTNTTNLDSHVGDSSNPHQVTSLQIGLENVDNTSDLDKPISNDTQSAIDSTNGEVSNNTTNITDNSNNIQTNNTNISNHVGDSNNPHGVTSSQLGLENVDNTSDLDKPISNDTQTALDDKVAIATNPSKTVKGAIKAFYDATTSTLEISIDGVDIP